MFIVLEKFLKLNNFSRVISDFEDYYLSHPNFPSLFALTDTFSSLNIENVAARIDKDYLEDLPDNFLGYVLNEVKEVSLALVRKVDQEVWVTFEGKKPEQQTISVFKERWNGIVVAIEPERSIGREPHFTHSFMMALFVLGTIGVFAVLNTGRISSLSIIMYSIYVLGAVLSIAIIREKLNENPSEASRICSIGANTSCDTVIKSNEAKLTSWIDFSDLGVLFYGMALLAMLINPESFRLINTLSVLSLPVIVYSIWVQRTVLKTWCVLCLALAVLLIIQTSLIFSIGVEFSNGLIAFIYASLIMTVSWFFLRSYLEENSELSKKNTELLRFKRDFEIFRFLQEPINISPSKIADGKIVLGSPSNPVTLSIIVSPSCGHCHTAFKDALKLYQENPDRISLEIFYNLNPENSENPYLVIARNILQISKVQPSKAIEALSDWHVRNMDLNEWMGKWEQPEIHFEINSWLKTQYEWCVQNEFNYTPVKIINGSELSKHYTLEELKYFLSELSEPEE